MEGGYKVSDIEVYKKAESLLSGKRVNMPLASSWLRRVP
jgi:hypothetical protein